jgi:hypothetical protein
MGTSISDTYADSSHASTNYAGAQALRLQGSGGVTAYGYLLPKGFATGKDILTTSAILRVAASKAAGAATWTARRVTSKKANSDLTYSNRPTDTATGAVAVSPGALAVGDTVDFDVTTIVDGWAKGTNPNYGLRLDAGATADKRIHSANSKTTALRPKLIVTQYRKPSVPQVIAPNGNKQVSIARPTLRWIPSTDPLMKQTSYKVQINATDSWGAPTHDSGWVVSTAGEHVVDFDIADGETWFWRVIVRNGGNQESAPTPGQQFGRTVKPTFSITQPTGGVWTDSTPPVEWSALSAGVQTQFRVVHRVNTPTPAISGVVDSNELPGDDTSWTYDQPIIGFNSGPVTTRVYLWDDVDRVATPGDDVWIMQEEEWVYTPGATDPFDSIAAAKHPTLPAVVVSAERASTPDRIDWQRSIDDGPWVSIAITEGADSHVGGTTYELIDVTAPPHHDITYRAVAGTNHIDSDDNPTALINFSAGYVWLMDPDDLDFWVAFADKAGDGLAYGEDSEVIYPKGASVATVVFDAFHGWEGTVSGGIYGTQSSPMLGRTAIEMRNAFIRRVKDKAKATRILRLVKSDQNIPVIVRNATPQLREDEEISFGVTFDAIQQGELPWS